MDIELLRAASKRLYEEIKDLPDVNSIGIGTGNTHLVVYLVRANMSTIDKIPSLFDNFTVKVVGKLDLALCKNTCYNEV